jgi:homoserine kinase
MTGRSVTAYAPATISNLGPGFDILGVAIDAPGDTVFAQRRREPGIGFTLKTNQARVPENAQKNVAAHVARLMLREIKPGFGMNLRLHKSMPIGSGLGSSAASGVAAAMAVNALFTRPLRKEDLLRFALEGERFACGASHADNVAPSLLGGAQLIRSYSPLDVVRVPVHPSLYWIVVHPHLVVLTKKARAALPRRVPLRSAVQQSGNVAGLILALTTGDKVLLARSVEDVIVEPVRAKLLRGFQDVKDAALEAGSFGCSISGSGPSVFAIAPSLSKARDISRSMVRAFRRSAGVHCDVFISRTNDLGARIVWRKDS